MSEPQLSVRSTKARDLAHALARRTGQPINRLVEQALEHYDLELRQQSARTPIDVLS
ncbi:type II toxin-antitoxin system VapB family antitoxin, partial [Ensifer sp. P24N7]